MPWDVTVPMFALMVVSAFVIGVAKMSVGGFAAIAMAIFALVIPAKESTAAVLLLLLVGDLVASATYRKYANFALIWRILPAILPGIVLGAAFMRVVDDTVLKRSIGAILLVSVGLQIWLVRHRAVDAAGQASRGATVAAGIAAGFTTMTANAAGAVMALYLMLARVDKRRFVGTNAWFFFIVNLTKAPFSAALGLFPAETLRLTVMLAPAVLVGNVVGRWIVTRMSQRVFDWTVVVASTVAALALLLL